MVIDPQDFNQSPLPPSWKKLCIYSAIVFFSTLCISCFVMGFLNTKEYLIASATFGLIAAALIRQVVLIVDQEECQKSYGDRQVHLTFDKLGNKIDTERFYICFDCRKKNILGYDCSQCKRRY